MTATVLAAAALVVGCGGDSKPSGRAAASGLPQGSDPVELDPASFSADVDHRYFPLPPGQRWIYREIDEDGDRVEVTLTATSETKRIANGITARVVRDSVRKQGKLIEDTLDWYAQDDQGNVWYLGENTAEFENGRITTRGGSFEAGVDGALPGIIMPAEPRAGVKYRQEYYEGEAEDNGEVLSVDEQADVPAGHYSDLLLTKDTITIEPDVLEYKLYAPKVGLVVALGISGGGGREELVRVEDVGKVAMQRAATAPLGSRYP